MRVFVNLCEYGFAMPNTNLCSLHTQFGQYIKTLRKEKGLSRRDVAQELRIHVSSWPDGKPARAAAALVAATDDLTR